MLYTLRRKNGVLSLGIVLLVLSIAAEGGALVLQYMTANQIVGEYIQKFAIPAIVVSVVICVIGGIIQIVQNIAYSATHALSRGIERATNRAVDGLMSNIEGSISNSIEDAGAQELRLSNTSPTTHSDLLRDFPGFNIDVYKLRAESLVAASYNVMPLDEVKSFLADEYKSQFEHRVAKNAGQYVKHQSGLVQYQHQLGTTKRVIFEVTYKIGEEEKKAKVTFSNMAQISENGLEKQFCTNCRAPLSPKSLSLGRCEYCDVPIFAASDWLCTSVVL